MADTKSGEFGFEHKGRTYGIKYEDPLMFGVDEQDADIDPADECVSVQVKCDEASFSGEYSLIEGRFIVVDPNNQLGEEAIAMLAKKLQSWFRGKDEPVRVKEGADTTTSNNTVASHLNKPKRRTVPKVEVPRR